MDESTQVKVCTRCGVAKPRRTGADGFYRRESASDGLTSRCADCLRNLRRESGSANREREREYARSWRAANVKERAAALRRWRSENADHVREYARSYSKANADRVADRKRRWYQANRAAIEAQLDPERRREVYRRHRERNRDARAEAQRKRRVDRLGLRVEDVDLDALWTGLCGICGQMLDRSLAWPDPFSRSVDHIHPLALGGTHEATNLQWAHLFCNISKGVRVT